MYVLWKISGFDEFLEVRYGVFHGLIAVVLFYNNSRVAFSSESYKDILKLDFDK
jgi:hypothetical protein